MRRLKLNDSFCGVYWKWWMLRRGDCSMWIHESERDYLSRDQFKSPTAQHWCDVSRAQKSTEHDRMKEKRKKKDVPSTAWKALLPLEQISFLNLIILPSEPVSSAISGQGDTTWHTRVERHCADTVLPNLPAVYGGAAAACKRIKKTCLDVHQSSRGQKIRNNQESLCLRLSTNLQPSCV